MRKRILLLSAVLVLIIVLTGCAQPPNLHHRIEKRHVLTQANAGGGGGFILPALLFVHLMYSVDAPSISHTASIVETEIPTPPKPPPVGEGKSDSTNAVSWVSTAGTIYSSAAMAFVGYEILKLGAGLAVGGPFLAGSAFGTVSSLAAIAAANTDGEWKDNFEYISYGAGLLAGATDLYSGVTGLHAITNYRGLMRYKKIIRTMSFAAITSGGLSTIGNGLNTVAKLTNNSKISDAGNYCNIAAGGISILGSIKSAVFLGRQGTRAALPAEPPNEMPISNNQHLRSMLVEMGDRAIAEARSERLDRFRRHPNFNLPCDYDAL